MAQPHFVVFANEKGGTGKSTTAVHTAVALAASGHRVAALDIDSRQRTLTRYLENRAATIRRLEASLYQPAFEVLEDHSEAGLEAAIGRLSAQADVICRRYARPRRSCRALRHSQGRHSGHAR
jgi:chromosome partitioning protein